jgi:hypothetical protein
MSRSTNSRGVSSLLRLQAAAEMERRRRQRDRSRIRAEKSRLETWATDYEAFYRAVEIVPKSGVRCKFEPNEHQAYYIDARTARDILLKPRQIGITTEELIRDVWFFLTKPGVNVRVFCQVDDEKTLKEISAKIGVILTSLRSEGVFLDFARETTTEWTLPERNSSLAIAEVAGTEEAADKQGRGITIHRLHLTEMAYYKYARVFLNGALEAVPAASFGTEIVIESTPNGVGGTGGPFYQGYIAAVARKSGYAAHFFPWYRQAEYRTELEPGEVVTPITEREISLVRRFGISQEQLKWYRAKVAEKNSQEVVDQEYPSDEQTCFLSSGRTFFDRTRTSSLLLNASDPVRTETVGREGSEGTLRIWQEPEPRKRYLITIDPSQGVGGDPGAAVVHDRETGAHVATLHGQFSTWEMARLTRGPERLKEGEESKHGPPGLAAVYNDALVAVERNNHGHAVLQAYEREFTGTKVYEGRDKKLGWNNTAVSRASALDGLHEAHRNGTWSTPDAQTLGEMRDFVVTEEGRAEAEAGAHDDLVLAHAIAWDVLTHVRWKPPNGDRKPPPQDGSRWGDQRGF